MHGLRQSGEHTLVARAVPEHDPAGGGHDRLVPGWICTTMLLYCDRPHSGFSLCCKGTGSDVSVEPHPCIGSGCARGWRESSEVAVGLEEEIGAASPGCSSIWLPGELGANVTRGAFDA